MNWPELQYLIDTLGWTLLHFLWQGAALGVLFIITQGLAARAESIVRYRLSLGIFVAAGAAPVLTFAYLWDGGGGTQVAQTMGVLGVGAAAVTEAQLAWWTTMEQTLRPLLPWFVAAWFAGVALMSGRVCLDWWQVRQLTRRGTLPLTPDWERRARLLMRALGVSRPVRVLRSTIVRVPAVIGWLRPVILIPTAALTGLSPRQLELVIAHELAHIRRADYLVNLLQVVIETLLFYHPVVAWMSNQLRAEREHCCDDVVIATCGDTLTYAHALTELEAQRQSSYQTALAASGGHLSQRIYRLLDRQAPRRGALIWSLSLVVGLAAASVAVATQVAMNRVGTTDGGASDNAAPALATLQIPDARPAPDPATPAVRGEARAEATPASGSGTGARTVPDAVPAQSDHEAPPPAETLVEDIATSARATSQPVVSSPGPKPADPVANRSPGAEPESEAATQDGKASPAEENAADPIPASAELPSQGDADPEEAHGGPGAMQLAMARRAQEEPVDRARPLITGGKPLSARSPQYPRRARLRGIQGSVTAEFTIGRNGRVDEIRIVESSPASVFDRAVESALADWRFEPMYRDGEAVERRVSKVFAFTLNGKSANDETPADSCDPRTGTRICRPWSDAELLGGVQTLGQKQR